MHLNSVRTCLQLEDLDGDIKLNQRDAVRARKKKREMPGVASLAALSNGSRAAKAQLFWQGSAGEPNHNPDSHAQFYCATTPQYTPKFTRMTSEVWKAKFMFCISKLCQHNETQLPP